MSKSIGSCVLPKSTPQSARVEACAAILTQALSDWEQQKLKMGVEEFDLQIRRVLKESNLVESRVIYQVEKVGIHPDNREGDMAIPVDVQELLDRMVEDGFNPHKWNAWACTIPAGKVGDLWRQKNKELVASSKGYLADVIADELEIVTARGSHGTSALRAGKLGAKSMHPGLAHGGMLSREIICELAPSMREPFENGVAYEVIPGELALACPSLMSVLARIGNNFNDVFRLQSSLQICSRIHKLSKQLESENKNADWAEIARLAAQGNGGKTFEPKALKLCDFVREWAGGKSGILLKELESYEKTLDTKRKLSPDDLHGISKIESKVPRYVLALVKAMLTSPSCDAGGYSNTFNYSDLSSVSAGGRNQANSESAVELMQAAETYLVAYGNFSEADRAGFLSKLEVRLVMFVHGKRSAHRIVYDSFEAIAAAFWEEAKACDARLPDWQRIAEYMKKQAGGSRSGTAKVKELSMDGKVGNCELRARNMDVGGFVKYKSKNELFRIEKIKTDHVDIIPVDDEGNAKGAAPAKTVVSKADLVLSYVEHKIKPKKFLQQVADPCKHLEVLTYLVRGAVLKELTSLMSKSSEDDIKIMIAPERAAITTKAFAVGQLKLVAFSHLITVIPMQKDLAINALCLGTLTEPINANIVMRSANSFEESRSFVSKFFCAYGQCVKDARESNCELQWNEYTIKVDKISVRVKLPICVNNIKLEKGTVIKLLSADKVVEPEPAKKRAKKS